MILNESAFTKRAYEPSLIIHIAALVITFAYAIYNLLFDYVLIGALILLSGVFLVFATRKLALRAPRAIYYLLFFAFQLFALSTACHHYGIRGALLMYPVTASLFYVLSFPIAWKLAFIFFLSAMLGASSQLDTDLLIRFGISLGMSIIVSSSFSFIVEKQKDTLKYDANHDHLTKILNRRGLLEALNYQIIEAEKNREDVALFFVDLVKFKLVNDMHGHHIGDALLVAFSNRVSGIIRGHRSGRQENDYIFGRFSGDEFALSFSLNSKEQAESIAIRLMEVCNHPFTFNDVSIDLHISIGICFASQSNYNYTELISHADECMYAAKKLGGSNFNFHEA